MAPSGLLLLFSVVLLQAGVASAAPEDESGTITMDTKQAARFAAIALAGITREYPNKPGDVLAGPESVKSPREMHPAFYGCFDWHSAVHGHWMLIRLLARHPTLEGRTAIVAALEGNLTKANLEAETRYFDAAWNRSFERTYGWAWLLRLAQELRGWDHELGRRWAAHVRPLEARIVELTKAYLPKLRLPIRSGEHRDTAFALAFALDYARAVGDADLEALAVERARAYYLDDEDHPVRYEPSGHDFFSPGLNEADLMRRVLDRAAYGRWLDRFLPGLRTGQLARMAEPASVDDVTDGKLVHLAGLNLTRAWTYRGIASALPEGDARRACARRLAHRHTRAGVDYVFTGHYAGEHWLASFVVFLLTDAGI